MADVVVLAADDDPLVRGRVAMIAGRVGGTRAGEVLARLSQDRSDYVREVSALGLGAVAPRGASDPPAALDDRPVSGCARSLSALALGTLGDPHHRHSTLAEWKEAGGEREQLRLHEGVSGQADLRRIQRPCGHRCYA